MAEFKFSCPQCNQHIECDVGYSGMQINCPSCQNVIIVPMAPGYAAPPPASVSARPAYEAPPPPPPPASSPSLTTRQSTTVPASGRRFAGAPDPSGARSPKPKSKALRNVLVITACVVVLAGLGVGGWFGFTKIKAHQAAQEAKKGNPAAKVAAPTANAAMQALGILTKVRSAYTNFSSVTGDSTVTLFLDLSNLTMADVNPTPANARGARNANNARNATRRPPGMAPNIDSHGRSLCQDRAYELVLSRRGFGDKTGPPGPDQHFRLLVGRQGHIHVSRFSPKRRRGHLYADARRHGNGGWRRDGTSQELPTRF